MGNALAIWYLNHYATLPEDGGSDRPFELGKALSGFGYKFIVVCASHHHLRHHSISKKRLDSVVPYKGIGYLHLSVLPYQSNGILRFLNMSGYSLSAYRLKNKVESGHLKKPDLIIASCAHIFSYLAGYGLSRYFKSKLIYEVRDLWPLSLVELAGVHPIHPVIGIMSLLEKHAYRNADAVVALQPHADAYMCQKGLSHEKFYYIPNGVAIDNWQVKKEALPEKHASVLQDLKKKNKLIVMYTGAHGPPNALDQILDLAQVSYSGERPYHFVLIGDGISKDSLISRMKRDGVDFVTFLPRVNKNCIPNALEQADICFLGWQGKPIYRLGISPNKLGDYMMASKPILHAVRAGNDPVAEAGSGISVNPFKPNELDAALNVFSKMERPELSRMGEKGKNHALTHLEWSVLGKKFNDLIEDIL